MDRCKAYGYGVKNNLSPPSWYPESAIGSQNLQDFDMATIRFFDFL
jgi:hypothetical protein